MNAYFEIYLNICNEFKYDCSIIDWVTDIEGADKLKNSFLEELDGLCDTIPNYFYQVIYKSIISTDWADLMEWIRTDEEQAIYDLKLKYEDKITKLENELADLRKELNK